MKVGDLVKAHNKVQTIGVVMCVEASRIQVFAEGEMIKGYYKTVLLITHLDSLKDIADMTIDIERQDGYAYVSQ